MDLLVLIPSNSMSAAWQRQIIRIDSKEIKQNEVNEREEGKEKG